MKNLIKYSFSNIVLILIGALPISHAATISSEEFKEYGPEQAYWVVSIDCEGGSDAIVVQRKTDGSEWCAKELEGFCAATKPEAAEKVCGEKFTTELASLRDIEKEKALAAEKQLAEQQERRRAEAARAENERKKQADSARQNKISIDEKLLEIEQEKLALRREELQLQRRAVEIREELKALESE